jgi:hypothetical protein
MRFFRASGQPGKSQDGYYAPCAKRGKKIAQKVGASSFFVSIWRANRTRAAYHEPRLPTFVP